MLPTPPPSPKPCLPCNPEDRLGQVLADRIQLTDILGVGAYGTVYKAKDVLTNADYAVKALNKVGLDHRQRRFQDREIRLHHRASEHRNVVSMQMILDSSECTFVVLEFCPEGDLFSKITEEGDYIGNDFKARHVFTQILDAVRHCHSKGVYHRDLKPENVLVSGDGWDVKLADFGLATEDRITSDFGCGSTFYMSPEPNDVWSLGVILVNLTCGRNPWKRAAMDDSTFRAFMRDRNFLQSILPISDGLNRILQRIFEVDPSRRIGLSELREAIDRCPRLGQSSVEDSLPPSPPYSPVETPVDSPLVFAVDGLDSVPNLDPLPVQQYPAYCGQQYNTSPPSFAPHGLPTPPGSNHGSPRLQPYTYHKSAVPTFGAPFAGTSTGYIPSFHSWAPRCSNFVPNLANQACWRNVSVF